MHYLLLASVVITASDAVPTVPLHGVFERSIEWQSAGYENPWEDVRLAVVLTSPGAKEVGIGGFYYEPNTWKFRFSPSEVGEWKWTAQIKDKTKSETLQGSFTVTDSESPGFVRPNPHNTFRWVFDDGTPYYPLGMGDCVRAREGKDPLEKMGMDGDFRGEQSGHDGWEVSFDEYLSAYSDAGVNLFRWSVDNCAFGLYEKIDPEDNVYKQREGIWGDRLALKLRKHGFRIYMAFFGFKPPYPNDSEDPAKMAAVKRYVEYIVNRYGAYVDFWELMNEYPNAPDTIDDDWYAQVAGYLKSIDPYHHAVSTSWQRPDIEEIDVNSPHWYEQENEFRSDLEAIRKFRNWKGAGKPVVVGEQGNSQANWDARSAVRMRIRTWATFFVEGSLVFWNTSFAKDYRQPVAANIYLGPQERGYLKVLQDFTRGFDPRAKMVEIEAAPKSKVRALALSGPAGYAVYLHNYVDHTSNTVGSTVKIAPSLAGTATWICPSTGETVESLEVTAGEQTLAAPEFVTDIALKIAPR